MKYFDWTYYFRVPSGTTISWEAVEELEKMGVEGHPFDFQFEGRAIWSHTWNVIAQDTPEGVVLRKDAHPYSVRALLQFLVWWYISRQSVEHARI